MMIHHEQLFHSAKIGWQFGCSAFGMALGYWWGALHCFIGGIISWVIGGIGGELP